MNILESKLRNLSSGQLLQLLDDYYVRLHDGTMYSGNGDLSTVVLFILKWLEPEYSNVQGTPYDLIRQQKPFRLSLDAGKNTLDLIFGDKIAVSNAVLEDFGKYPIRVAFNNYDPWDLLMGYIESNDRSNYFVQITGENPANFLNNTERIFYLTRGYGRPNKHISPIDHSLRTVYMNAAPTALVALADIFKICPTRQDPNVIREELSGVNLNSIDAYHRNAVQRITQCLGTGNICQSSGQPFTVNEGNFDDESRSIGRDPNCNPGKAQCFKSFLESLGILSIFEYDPFYDVFKSNISQLNLYRDVRPNNIWNYEDVVNMPTELIGSYIMQLSDSQLLSIETPQGFRYADLVDLSIPINRLRSRLVAGAIHFLTSANYFVLDDNIYYGRLIDSRPEIMTREQLIDNIKKYKALIDPRYRVISISQAEHLNSILEDEVLHSAILKTKHAVEENLDIVNSLTSGQKAHFKVSFSEEEIDIDTLENLIPDQLRGLILWSNGTPLAITFKDYFEYWAPTLIDIILDTLKYYSSLF